MGTTNDRDSSLGRLIRRHREHAELSINELARRVDLSPSIISRIESGEHVHPRTDTLVRIASGLGTSAAELFAAAGYTTPHDLPPFRAYLKTRYADLPAQAQQELDQHFRRLQRRYGPRDREDE